MTDGPLPSSPLTYNAQRLNSTLTEAQKLSLRYLYTHVHNSILHNCQKGEAKCSLMDEWINCGRHVHVHALPSLNRKEIPTCTTTWWWCSHQVMSDSATPWTVAHQAPLSMEFSRQEHWSGWLFSSPSYLPDPGIELGLCTAGRFRNGLSPQG